MYSLYIWLGLVIAHRALATLVNVTVDDTDFSIIYSPSSDWSFGPTCASCTAKLDASKTFNSTWHDTLFSPLDPAENYTQTIEFSFTGVAIYVFGILSNAINNPSGNADYLIYIDDEQIFNFVHTPSGDGSFVYNSTLYSNNSLSEGHHILKLQNGRPQDVSSFFLFDYVVYTVNNEDAKTSSFMPSSAPTITSQTSGFASNTTSPSTLHAGDAPASSSRSKVLAGILVPVLILSIGIAAVLVFYRRRVRRRNQANIISTTYPFPSASHPEFTGGPTPPSSLTKMSAKAVIRGEGTASSPLTDTSLAYPSDLQRQALSAASRPVYQLTPSTDPESLNPTITPVANISRSLAIEPFGQSGPSPTPHIVLARIQASDTAAYPMLAAWSQIPVEESDISAPPAYTSVAELP